MAYTKLVLCLASAAIIQGCTVLGFATDVALHSVVDDANEGKQRVDPNYVDPAYFTNIGLEHDIKTVSGFIKDVVKARQANNVEAVQETRSFAATYANKQLCKQPNSELGECHGPDYYQEFYIKIENSAVKPISVADSETVNN